MFVMYAHFRRFATLVAAATLGSGVAGAQTQLNVPSSSVSATAIAVSGAIGGRIINCPPRLALSPSAVCLLATGTAASFKPKISQKFTGVVAQDWQTGKGGSNSLVVKGADGLIFVLLAQAGPDVLAVVSPPQRATGGTVPKAPATGALPSGATRGVSYVRASDLKQVISVAALPTAGQYRVGGAARNVTLTAGSASAQLGSAPYTLPGTPYLAGAQLYVPVNMLRDLSCTVTAQSGQNVATVACNGASVRVNTVSF